MKSNVTRRQGWILNGLDASIYVRVEFGGP